MTSNPDKLLSGFQQGDPDAFEQIFKHFYRDISYFTEKVTGNKQEAEDITIQTFTKLFERYQLFNSLANIRAFLYVTARNASFNYLRDIKRLSARRQEFMSHFEDENNLENEEIKAETLKTIYAAIENLPDECKKIFKLIYLEGLNTPDIAALLNISEATIRSQKRRALQLLKLSLAENHYFIALLIYSAVFHNFSSAGFVCP
jgi:RNA polymerase sigma-70 factor (family 1)